MKFLGIRPVFRILTLHNPLVLAGYHAMRSLRLPICALLVLLCSAAQAATVENIRIWSENGKTRVVLDLSSPASHNIFTLRGPDRLVVDLKSSRLSNSLKNLPQGTGSVRAIRSAVRDGLIEG